MIQEVRIENFKSVQKLKLPLGRFNVLIGENGCGKSNILEAIAMGVAAANDKLDNVSLNNRGIRVPEPRLMRSGFDKENLEDDITFSFLLTGRNKYIKFTIYNDNNPYSKWIVKESRFPLTESLFENIIEEYIKNDTNLREILFQNVEGVIKENDIKDESIINELLDSALKRMALTNKKYFLKPLIEKYPQGFQKIYIDKFLIFSIEYSNLIEFKDAKNEPLDNNGNGLFKLLTVIAKEKPEQFLKIKECLKEMFDWLEDFGIPNDLVFTEKRLNLKDRFLPDIQYISQQSANEGFLFVLFYVTLFVSDYTPSFFAIDNIDAALNPKLCRKLITVLTRLAREHDKQVILTTHNPSVLDGLDLNDEEQKLMVVYRNVEGRTKVNQVQKPNVLEGQIPVKLSEAFLRGYIGGLPKNF